MALLSQLLYYIVVLGATIGVLILGVKLGGFLRKRKDRKNTEIDNNLKEE